MKTAILYLAGEKHCPLTIPFTAAEDGTDAVNWVLDRPDFLEQAACRYGAERPDLLVLEDGGEARGLAVGLARRLGGAASSRSGSCGGRNPACWPDGGRTTPTCRRSTACGRLRW